jgi:hypothetical protein
MKKEFFESLKPAPAGAGFLSYRYEKELYGSPYSS